MSYNEAKQWIRDNRPDIQTKQKFIDFRSDKEFPDAMPKDVFGRYRKTGDWISWGHFLKDSNYAQ